MIQVRYKGRLGNQLFQYCFGRILAEQLGYRLDAEPVEGFSGTCEKVSGTEYDESNPLIFSGVEYPDIEQLLRERPNRRIIINAYLQRYAYYAHHLEKIRKWLRLTNYDRRDFSAGPDSLTIHIRLGDYLKCHWTLAPEYYIQQIETIPHQSLVIVTDSPDSTFLDQFTQYQPRIVHGAILADFKWLLNAQRLVLSQSTFGWWAALLSDAEVWMPEPGNSIWSQDSHIDLRVVDNPEMAYCASGDTESRHPYA